MTPFDLIGTVRYRESPFSVPCPHCGSVATYQPENTNAFPSNASRVAVEHGGADREVLQGTVFGACKCNNRDCEESVHFLASYSTGFDDSEEPAVYPQMFVIKYFFPSIPLLRIPVDVPERVKELLVRSFAPAFTDCSASGNLLRSSIEAVLTDRRVPRFVIANAGRRRLTLHDRIQRLPQSLERHKEGLLAAKWIGNTASHDELSVAGLRVGYSIVETFLEELYGTQTQELNKIVKRINKRKRP